MWLAAGATAAIPGSSLLGALGWVPGLWWYPRMDSLGVDLTAMVAALGFFLMARRLQAKFARNFAVADDINSAPGKALHALAAQGKLHVAESYGPFEAPSPHNPCMRTATRGLYCVAWGFAVYVYPHR